MLALNSKTFALMSLILGATSAAQEEVGLYNAVQSTTYDTTAECGMATAESVFREQNMAQTSSWPYYGNCACAMTTNFDGPQWWSADFLEYDEWYEVWNPKSYQVKEVQILTRLAPSGGNDQFDDANIYVGDVLCANTGSGWLTDGAWETFTCAGDGATGSAIRIEKPDMNHLTFCGIKVLGGPDL